MEPAEEAPVGVTLRNTSLGKGNPSKTDEFSEKFQTAVDPPLIFVKSCCGFFIRLYSLKNHTCGIFLKSPGYESIKNNDPCCQIQSLNFKFWGWLGPRLLVRLFCQSLKPKIHFSKNIHHLQGDGSPPSRLSVHVCQLHCWKASKPVFKITNIIIYQHWFNIDHLLMSPAWPMLIVSDEFPDEAIVAAAAA